MGNFPARPGPFAGEPPADQNGRQKQKRGCCTSFYPCATAPLLAVLCKPKNSAKKRSPRFHTSSVSLASLIARIIVSTSRKSFSSIELSITSMRLLHPLASLLRLISRPISWKSNLRSSRSNRIDITKCNFTFQVLVFERFIFSYYYIFNFIIFR